MLTATKSELMAQGLRHAADWIEANNAMNQVTCIGFYGRDCDSVVHLSDFAKFKERFKGCTAVAREIKPNSIHSWTIEWEVAESSVLFRCTEYRHDPRPVQTPVTL